MKRLLLRRILPLLLCCLLLGAALRLSDNALMPQPLPQEKPYYLPEQAVVAELGGMGLTYGEFRYHAWQALTRDLGRQPEEADLFYDELLAEQVKELALLRAARWRGVTAMAMAQGLSAPEPEEELVELLCREPFVTRAVAESLLRAESLSSLVSLLRYGEEGSLLSPEAILDWGGENGVIRLRALWLSTDPEIYGGAERESRWEQVSIFAAQLRRGETDFDSLAAAYGEDESWSAGRQLAPGGAEEALYAAGAELDMGACAPIRLESGIYLLLRCPLEPEEMTRTGDGAESLRSLAARGLFRQELGETAGSLERRYRAEWKRIRMDLLFRQEEG